MKSPPKKVSEDDCLTITRRSTRPKTTTNVREYSESIPIDLIIEIFLILPAKSIAKCCCVSKQWASILRRQDFTELFLTRSLARPQLLFACVNEANLFFLSTPQPQTPKDYSSSIAASYHMKVTFNLRDSKISHVNGLVLVRYERISKGRKKAVLVTSICNPSTGQSLTIPQVKTRRRTETTSFLGYDPIDKQYKILFIIWMDHKMVSEEHQVLTLGGNEKPSWRIIESCIPYFPIEKEICINGVLYYPAMIDDSPDMIVCFDVRFETFRIIKNAEGLTSLECHGTMINYNGKLGSVLAVRCIGGMYQSFKLFVLEDVEKEEWSEHTYVLSASCLKVMNVVGKNNFNFVGVTRKNEIVLSSYNRAVPLYIVYYYDTERTTMTRFEIQGIINASRLHTFIDHIEDVKLM